MWSSRRSRNTETAPSSRAQMRDTWLLDLESERARPFDGRPGAADGAAGPVEARQEAVAGGVDLPPAEACQLPTDQLVVALEQLPPRAIAEPGGESWPMVPAPS